MSLLIITAATSSQLILSSSAHSDEEEEHGEKTLTKTLRIIIKGMIKISHCARHRNFLFQGRQTNNYNDYFMF